MDIYRYELSIFCHLRRLRASSDGFYRSRLWCNHLPLSPFRFPLGVRTHATTHHTRRHIGARKQNHNWKRKKKRNAAPLFLSQLSYSVRATALSLACHVHWRYVPSSLACIAGGCVVGVSSCSILNTVAALHTVMKLARNFNFGVKSFCYGL